MFYCLLCASDVSCESGFLFERLFTTSCSVVGLVVYSCDLEHREASPLHLLTVKQPTFERKNITNSTALSCGTPIQVQARYLS